MVKSRKIYVMSSLDMSVDVMDAVTSFYQRERAPFLVSSSYDYSHLSLHQLVLLAKKRKYAMDVLINQSLRDIIIRSKAIVRRNPKLDFEEVYYSSIHLLKKCVYSYQSRKGEFDHYFHHAMSQSMRFMSYGQARRMDADRKKFGYRVDMTSFSDNHLLCDSAPDMNEVYRSKAIMVDVGEYIKSLPPTEKEVMRLFLRGCSSSEIAKEMKMTQGKTERMIQRLLKTFYVKKKS